MFLGKDISVSKAMTRKSVQTPQFELSTATETKDESRKRKRMVLSNQEEQSDSRGLRVKSEEKDTLSDCKVLRNKKRSRLFAANVMSGIC